MIASITRRAAPLARSCQGTAATSLRCFSDGGGFIQRETADNGTTIVKLANPPVNILTLEVANELFTTFQDLADDFDVKGVVLTSAKHGVFSAGLNIHEILSPTRASFETYWECIMRLFMELYKFPKPLVVGINGAAPAGGCMLSLCGDSRIMSSARNGKYTIGLNEVHLGFPPPQWLCEAYRSCVSVEAERHIKLGMLLPPAEALRSGLVDAVVEEDDSVLPACLAEARKWQGIPFTAFETAKLGFRAPLLQLMTEDKQRLLDFTWDLVSSEETQQVLQAYMASLKKQVA